MRKLPKSITRGTVFGLNPRPKPAWLKQAWRDLYAEHPEMATADDLSVWPNGPGWAVTVYWGTEGKTYALKEPVAS